MHGLQACDADVDVHSITSCHCHSHPSPHDIKQKSFSFCGCSCHAVLALGGFSESFQRQVDHIGWLMEGHSGGLQSGKDIHSVWVHNLAHIIISRGIVGGVLCIVNQNRHYWMPPKWPRSSAVSAMEGSLSTIWHLFLWTSYGRAAM